MNSSPIYAHTNAMTEKELWQMFAKTGDVEWYSMYRTLKESKCDENKK